MDFEEIAVEIEVSGLARRNIMQSTKTKGSGIKATIKNHMLQGFVRLRTKI